MSFNELILPHFLIADLYKNVLIETQVAETVTTKQIEAIQPIALKFLGENRKQVSIIVIDNNAVYIDDEKLNLLTKLLAACKLTLADVAIVNLYNKNITYNQIKQELNPQFLLLMGVDIKQFALPIIFPEYKIQHYNNCQILIAKGLQQFIGETQDVKMEKSKLWLCLKTIFGV